MKKHKCLLRRLFLTILWSTVGLQLSQTAHSAAANSVDLKFNYTVLQGSCDVGVGGDPSGQNGALDFGEISTRNFSTSSWQSIGDVMNFYVSLANCSGAGNPSTRPRLTITGATLQTSPSNKIWVFVDTASTAVGMGFGIYKNDTTTSSADMIADARAGRTEKETYIDIPGYTKNGSYIRQSVPVIVPLQAFVTCGDTCTPTSLRAGTLTSSITFNFVYH
ncbi:fimbrial protein [Yersinia enterocolitica]|nr:type 1 fimbrial protein [Yersinia enterocolitica]EKN5104364.1 type 1 fimbrial protein [Yersinia enterocolitica]